MGEKREREDIDDQFKGIRKGREIHSLTHSLSSLLDFRLKRAGGRAGNAIDRTDPIRSEPACYATTSHVRVKMPANR